MSPAMLLALALLPGSMPGGNLPTLNPHGVFWAGYGPAATFELGVGRWNLAMPKFQKAGAGARCFWGSEEFLDRRDADVCPIGDEYAIDTLPRTGASPVPIDPSLVQAYLDSEESGWLGDR